jgi:processing peptidase subunit alpha
MRTTSSLVRNGRLIGQNVGKHLSKSVLRRPLNTSSEPFIQITTLPNKIRVATESTPGHFSSVGLYIDAGARYETPQSSGVSHFLDRMAFKVNVLKIFI